MRSGQILILVLLIVVVSLAVGLSVASRNITNLRTSTQTEQSQRAFTAAEAGVEDLLSRIKDTEVKDQLDAGQTYSSTVDVYTNSGDPSKTIKADITVKPSNVYVSKIVLGDVAQIDVSCSVACPDKSIDISWASVNDATENPPATIEVTVVRENSGTYTQERYLFTSGSQGVNETGGIIVSCLGNSDYKCTKTVQINGPSNGIGTNAQIVRIKPFWSDTTVKVAGSGFNLNAQTYDIESVSSTETGVTRKVKVTRTALPQLPAAFDYVLYSENSIIK